MSQSCSTSETSTALTFSTKLLGTEARQLKEKATESESKWQAQYCSKVGWGHPAVRIRRLPSQGLLAAFVCRCLGLFSPGNEPLHTPVDTTIPHAQRFALIRTTRDTTT